MIQAGDAPLTLGAGVSGTAYTPAKVDVGRVIETTNGSAVTVTLPLVSVAGFIVGSTLSIYQAGAGQVTVAGSGGVTLRSANGLKTRAQYSVINLRMRANDEWVLSGDTAV